MAEKNKTELKEKLITMSPEVFEVLSADALRCKRSVNKQIEAILSAYTGAEDVNLSSEGIRNAQNTNGNSKGVSATKAKLGKEKNNRNTGT